MSRRGSDGRTDMRGPRRFLKQAIVSGTAIVVPVLITAVVLLIAMGLLSSLLEPLAIPIRQALGIGAESGSMLPEVIALVVLVVTILAVGAFSESGVASNRLEDGVDATMSRLPGIGSIYGPLDRISEMLLEPDTDSFQEVVLVEYPEAGSYCVAFKTAEPPGRIREAVEGGEDMITVFMPMGPNPFMGGFIMHTEESQVHDVDLSVEEGVTSIVSFGVAIESEVLDEKVDDLGASKVSERIERYENERVTTRENESVAGQDYESVSGAENEQNSGSGDESDTGAGDER